MLKRLVKCALVESLDYEVEIDQNFSPQKLDTPEQAAYKVMLPFKVVSTQSHIKTQRATNSYFQFVKQVIMQDNGLESNVHHAMLRARACGEG